MFHDSFDPTDGNNASTYEPVDMAGISEDNSNSILQFCGDGKGAEADRLRFTQFAKLMEGNLHKRVGDPSLLCTKKLKK